MSAFLTCYPFSDPDIQLVEGFSVYDGVLKDEPGTPHKGIDYVLKRDKTFSSFDIYAMHAGEAYRGESESWGTFVVIRTAEKDGVRHETVYAHLGEVREDLPVVPQNSNEPLRTVPTKAGERLGAAGTTGWTNDIIQLHIELHRVSLDLKQREKLDPYGIYDKASSGKYPQPGESLEHLEHFWTSNNPRFAT